MITIAALITPMVIATAPMAITVDEQQMKYSHEEQVIVSLNDTPIYYTSSGTQTFDGSGKPYDSDSD